MMVTKTRCCKKKLESFMSIELTSHATYNITVHDVIKC